MRAVKGVRCCGVLLCGSEPQTHTEEACSLPSAFEHRRLV